MATLAALATGIVPTAVALAAPAAFSASSITTAPAPNSSNVVPANRPVVIATFSDNLASTSSITLVVKGSGNNLCSSFQVSGKQVSCTPTSDLALNTTYDAVGHGVSTSGARADTQKLEFTVSYPAFQPGKSAPIPSGSVIKGNEPVTAQFDQPITGDSSNTFAPDGAFKVFEVNADGSRGTQLPGTISFGGNPVQGSDGTVTFKAGLADGKYEAAVLVFGEDGSGKKNPAAVGHADYYFWVNGAPPANLTSPAEANNVTAPAFPFSGTAAPGLTITVTVPDPSTPGGLNDASNSGVVPPCDAAPSCPWTVKVDISGLNDGSYHWSAQASDAGSTNKVAANAPGTVTIDQSAPSTPKSSTATISADSRTVTVGATHASGDTDITSYHVTITDPEGNKVEAEFPAVGEDLPNSNVDVTTLDDGVLTVLAQAEDAAGNRSDAPKNPPLGPGTPTVTKNQGLFPNLGTSDMTVNGGTIVTFADAAGGVQTPTVVTLRFTQPIKLSYTDNSKPQSATTHNSSLCVATTAGNCVTSGSPSLSDDGRGLLLKVNNPLPDRTYELKATTYSKNNCPDVNVGGTNNCSTANHSAYDGVVVDAATGQPYTFTVDTTGPTVAVTSVAPNPITSGSVTNVSVSGTVSADAKTVSLVITSAGGRGSRLANATITPSAGGGAPATWSVSGLDLSALPDGQLTITVKATDAAGNSGTGVGHAQLRAHGSRLTESVASPRVTVGKAVLVTGRLTDQNNDAISSATVTVQPRYAGGKLGRATTATTDSKGRWSTTQAPVHNATFVAAYDGSSTTPVHDAATAGTARVAVRALVTIASPRGKASPVQRVKGRVKPNKKGARVSVYRKTAHGAALLGSGRVNKHSRFSVRVHLPKGKVTIFARIGKTAGNAAGRSRSVRVAVS